MPTPTHQRDQRRRRCASGARRGAPETTSCRRRRNRDRRQRPAIGHVVVRKSPSSSADRETERPPCPSLRRRCPRGRPVSSLRRGHGPASGGTTGVGRGSVGVAGGACAVFGASLQLFDADFLFERVLQLVRGALELRDALAERLAQFGQLSRAEDDQGDDGDDDHLRHADGTKHCCHAWIIHLP